MRLFPRWSAFSLAACFCAFAVGAGTATGEPLPGRQRNHHPDIWQTSATPQSNEVSGAKAYITIPGPLSAFLRMGGVSRKAEPDEVLPLFAHFVEIYGHEGPKEKSGRPTEALLLFKRYFTQAQTLASAAGPQGTLHFSTCEESKPLLAILGYRLKDGCGSNPSIEVADPEKAFITVDSGFPLAEMEQALMQGQQFSTPYPSVRLPLIYTKGDWTGNENSTDADLIEAIADRPVLARLYWALSRVDDETRDQLRKTMGMTELQRVASVLDFYGPNLAIRNGRVAVPGGTQAEAAWKGLVGASPGRPGEFVVHLLQRDNGVLAEFYDSIARAPLPQQTYLTRRDHLERYYAAFRGNSSSDDAVRPVLRPGADLLLFVTRLPLGDDGQPLVPGSLSVWQDAFRRRSASKTERTWARKSGEWTTPDQLVQALFALSRSAPTDGPLDMYLILSEIDRRRPAGKRMSPETARLLIAHFSRLRDQYQVFCEFSGLDDASIFQFVKTTERIDRIRDPLLRGDTMGLFEASIGLWQVFARQGQISGADLSASWQRAISPFGSVSNSAQLFDTTSASLAEMMKTISGDAEITQEKIIDLLAGPKQSTSEGTRVHDRIAGQIGQVLSEQRLVSLDTLLELRRDFGNAAQNASGVAPRRMAELAQELEESRSPRAMFTEAERAEWAPEHERNQHVVVEMKTNWMKLVGGSARESESARGALTPFLRDSMVGLNYAYYQPPGGQILRSSPLFVRTHDFLASDSTDENAAWRVPRLLAVGQTAANGAHLSGALVGLPYVLAEVEQDFIVPENVQALIWHETAAHLLLSSVMPRWWSTPREALHAAGLYQKTGEELITAAAKDANLRAAVMQILSRRLLPGTLSEVNEALYEGHSTEALDGIAPADLFYLAAEFQKQFPGKMFTSGPAGAELETLLQRNPDQVDSERLSHEFGVPHPALAESYECEMLNVKPFPSLMSYASELLAESWESTNLYWARLADEMGYSPVMLNELAPMLTRRMVEKIFASDFDDWAALIRAMREAGEEFRQTRLSGKPNAAAPQAVVPPN